MNEELEPCDDFYQFACDNYHRTTIVSSEKPVLNSFMTNMELMYDSGKELLTMDDEVEESEFISDKLIKDFYAACMDEIKIEQQGLTPLTDIFEEVGIGRWPITQTTNNDGLMDWFDILPKMASKGLFMPLFINFNVKPDPDNNQIGMLNIVDPNFGLSADLMNKGTENKRVQLYFNFMLNVSMLFVGMYVSS